MRILIKRRVAGVSSLAAQSAPAAPSAAPVPSGYPVVRPAPGRRGGASALRAPNASPAPDPSVAVVAPLTGVFYSRPSPSSDAFAQVGETVQPGQVVAIVEAMKVFNEIKAEMGGVIAAILPKDGQLVQKGDALIRVKPV